MGVVNIGTVLVCPGCGREFRRAYVAVGLLNDAREEIAALSRENEALIGDLAEAQENVRRLECEVDDDDGVIEMIADVRRGIYTLDELYGAVG